MTLEDMCIKYADYIIQLANEDNKKLSNTMLQKILFYSYVDYAVKTEKQLFSDSFYAWDRGPVLPEIYNEYSVFQYGVMKPKGTDSVLEDDYKKEILRENYVKLIDKNIFEIVAKTHEKGSPWEKHYSKNFFDFLIEGKDVIPFEEILNYYKDLEHYNNLYSFKQ